MATINWELRQYFAGHLREDGRWILLTILITHCNPDLRCWPGMVLLCKESGMCPEMATRAKKWLIEHNAIILVPYNKRVGDEMKLPLRKHVYQLTGTVVLNDGSVEPYLFLTPEVEAKISAAIDDVSQGEISCGEISCGETKGITSIKGNTNKKDKPAPASQASPAPLAGGRVRLHNTTGTKDKDKKNRANEGEKQHGEHTALESLLLNWFPANHDKLPREVKDRLPNTVSSDDDDSFPSPEDLWKDNEEQFRQYLDWRFRKFKKDKPDYFENRGRMAHFVNIIRQYDKPGGWFEWQEHDCNKAQATQAQIDRDNDLVAQWEEEARAQQARTQNQGKTQGEPS